MAEIVPLRGILYSPLAGDPARLLAPPYDVLAEADRVALEAESPYSCVRLILPRPIVSTGGAATDEDSKYAHAGADCRAWLAEGVLARDEAPAIYRYHQVFTAGGREVVRKGYIARIRLHRFDEGVVLPHERTLSGPKVDRLKLMRALGAQEFSQVFGLYGDPERETDALFTELEATPPFIDATTSDGVRQRLWRLTDGKTIAALAAFMAPRKVYIADGHHRYETMLTLRDELRAQATSPRSAIEYGVMFFCNMDDPGLVVFPTHRVLHGLAHFDRADLIERARAYFTVEEAALSDADGVRRGLLERAHLGATIGLATPGSGTITYLRARADLAPGEVPALSTVPALRELDVSVLHAIVFETLLGITREAQAAQSNLGYVKTYEAAMAALGEPGVQAVFFMNPTRVSQVRDVADAGEVMPQKSTFFYPKIASGLVMNPLDPTELVDAPIVDAR